MSELIPPSGMDMTPQTGPVSRFQPGEHESSEDVSLGVIVGFSVALVALCVASAVLLAAVMWFVQIGIDREQSHRPPLFHRTANLYGEAGPAVKKENPEKDYRKDPDSVPERKQAEDAIGPSAYGWVEPGKVARIPIDRAIKLLGEKGELPHAPSAAPASPEPNPADAVRRARENPAPQAPVPADTKGL
jgi:hypothetical protein